MTDEGLKEIAQRLVLKHVEDSAVLIISEDEELADRSEEDLRRLYELITTAKVSLSWKPAMEAGIFSDTMRSMHPTESQLRTIEAVERQQLTPGIHADMVAHTGEVLDFEFTGKVTIHEDGRIWHEFVVVEEDLTLYATLRRDGFVSVERELPE